MDLETLRIIIAGCLILVSVAFAWMLIAVAEMVKESTKSVKNVNRITSELEQNIVAPIRAAGKGFAFVSNFISRKKIKEK